MSTKADICKETGVSVGKFEWYVEAGILQGANRRGKHGSHGVGNYPADTSEKIKWLRGLGSTRNVNECVIELVLHGWLPSKHALLKPALITCIDRLLTSVVGTVTSQNIARQVHRKMAGYSLEARQNARNVFSFLAGEAKPGTIEYTFHDLAFPQLQQAVRTTTDLALIQAAKDTNYFLAQYGRLLEATIPQQDTFGPWNWERWVREVLPGHLCKNTHSPLQVLRPLLIARACVPLPKDTEGLTLYLANATAWARQHPVGELTRLSLPVLNQLKEALEHGKIAGEPPVLRS